MSHPNRFIFISYRRQNAGGYEMHLRMKLAQELGEHSVLVDRSLTAIDPGTDFREQIARLIERAGVILVLIGPGWLETLGLGGKARIHELDDVVREEIRYALNSGKLVVPTLVGDASMPSLDYLPTAIRDLANRQAFRLANDSFEADVDRLLTYVSRSVPGWRRFVFSQVESKAVFAGCVAFAAAIGYAAFSQSAHSSGLFEALTVAALSICVVGSLLVRARRRANPTATSIKARERTNVGEHLVSNSPTQAAALRNAPEPYTPLRCQRVSTALRSLEQHLSMLMISSGPSIIPPPGTMDSIEAFKLYLKDFDKLGAPSPLTQAAMEKAHRDSSERLESSQNEVEFFERLNGPVEQLSAARAALDVYSNAPTQENWARVWPPMRSTLYEVQALTESVVWRRRLDQLSTQKVLKLMTDLQRVALPEA